MLAVCKRIPQAVIPLTTLRYDVVSPPTQLDRSIELNRKEHDNGRDSNTTGEARREDEIVLGPQAQESVLHVYPAEPGDGHRRPDVREVVRRPGQCSVKHGDGMNLTQPANLLEPPLNDPEDEREGDTKGKADQQGGVLPALAENLDGADGAPQHRCGEKGVDARAGEVVGSMLGANTGNLIHLEVQDANADERGDDGCDHLRPEGVPGWDFAVMSELQIVREPNGVSTGHIAEGLEVIHGKLSINVSR